MSVPQIKVGRAIRVGILELALFLLGVLLVRREIWQLHSTTFTIAHWQQGLLIALSAVDGWLTGAFGSRSRNVEHLPAYKNVLKFGLPLFFVLYVGCCAVCERLSVGIFPVPQFVADLIRTAGIAVILASLGLRIWSQNSAPVSLMAQPVDPLAPPRVLKPTESAYPHFAERHVELADDTTLKLPKLEEPVVEPVSKELLSDESSSAQSERADNTNASAESADEITPANPDLETPSEPIPALEEASTSNEVSETAQTAESIDEGSRLATTDEAPFISTEPASPFPTGPHKLLRYPDASARLVALIGLPLVFNCWLPILALPGIVVLLKWHISDREAFRISQLGEPYLQYRSRTWNLIPYIY